MTDGVVFLLGCGAFFAFGFWVLVSGRSDR